MNTQREELPEHRRIGNYRLEREIGRGGMGVVYLATHVTLERPVALKILRPELARESDVVERMLQEARYAAQITGQHVVRVIDVGQLDTGTAHTPRARTRADRSRAVRAPAGALRRLSAPATQLPP